MENNTINNNSSERICKNCEFYKKPKCLETGKYVARRDRACDKGFKMRESNG